MQATMDAQQQRAADGPSRGFDTSGAGGTIVPPAHAVSRAPSAGIRPSAVPLEQGRAARKHTPGNLPPRSLLSPSRVPVSPTTPPRLDRLQPSSQSAASHAEGGRDVGGHAQVLKSIVPGPQDLRVSTADGPAEAQARSVARGARTTVTPVAECGAPPPDRVRSLLDRPRPAGRPLPTAVRADLEHRLGHDLSHVRLHADPGARAAAEALDAHALTVGPDIYLGSDVDPGSATGRRLLAHEAAHVVQQGGTRTHIQLDRKVKTPARTITKVTLFVDRDLVVLELDGKDTITLKADYNGHPPPGRYEFKHWKPIRPFGGVANARGWVVQWTAPPGTTLNLDPSHTLTVVAGRPGSDTGPATGVDQEGAEKGGAEQGGAEKGGARDTGGIGGGAKGQGQADRGEGPGATEAGQTGAGGDAGAGDEAAVRLTAEEEEVWREIAKLMKGAGGPMPTESPAELVRLFKVLRAMVVDPKFGTTGESWIKFAHFLDQNKDKIEGYFRSEKGSKLTTAILQKIINDYGAFLASTKDQEGSAELTTDEDFEKEFKYDPGWRHLSPADRKLLLEYSRTVGGPASDAKIDFVKVGTSPKMGMALRLADTSVLGEMAEAAKNAFTDPRFLITLIVSMGIYVGLWLTPDPSWVTKLAAGALTAVMLAQFGIDDIYGFAVAWSDLSDDCTKATTVAELKAAGEAFLKRVGPIGFDIMMFIVMWRIGKLAGPKLSKIGAEMGVKRAQSRFEATQAKPGSGAKTIVEPGTHPVTEVRAAAGPDATATQILDALAARLPEAARDGLKQFRASVPDSGVLAALEGTKAPVRLLLEKAMTAEQVKAAKAESTKAQFDLARAKLIEAETIKDPALRKTVRSEQAQAIRNILKAAGTWDTPEFQDAFRRGDIAAVGRMLRQVVDKVRAAAKNARSTETQGAIGESLQRAILRTQYAGRKGVKFLTNLAVMKRLPGVRSIGDWAQAERARLKTAEPGISAEKLESRVQKGVDKLFEKDAHIYEAIGEVDTMVVEPRPDGRLDVLEMAEAKASGRASPTSAREQLTDVLAELRRIGDKSSTAQIFELQGKRGLGEDITRKLAVDALQQDPAMRTFGPEGDKMWDVTLGYTDAEFKALAQSLLRNLPPDKPQTSLPPTAPREKEHEQVP